MNKTKLENLFDGVFAIVCDTRLENTPARELDTSDVGRTWGKRSRVLVRVSELERSR